MALATKAIIERNMVIPFEQLGLSQVVYVFLCVLISSMEKMVIKRKDINEHLWANKRF